MQSISRLYFLDALRAFAILMMLQGHFISSLLDTSNVDTSQLYYRIWKYCRGFTAPVFFTITGWVFTFLLIKENKNGTNPRIKKGIKRGFELLLWGFLLRLNLPTLFTGQLNSSFLQPDVLHIIGISILCILLIYKAVLFFKIPSQFLYLLLTAILFLLEPYYNGFTIEGIPTIFSALLFKGNGGVFYLFPWLGYVFFGSTLALFFHTRYHNASHWSLPFIGIGLLVIMYSSTVFNFFGHLFESELLHRVVQNNYLFIRLGDVMVLLGLFMGLSKYFVHRFWNFAGTNTLPLYIVHYFLLYGSLTGFGLYKFYAKTLTFSQAFGGAVLFILGCLCIVYALSFVQSFRLPKIMFFLSTLALINCTAPENDCKQSPKQMACTKEYKPVCGCDDITYSNGCVAESNGVLRWTEGACKN